MNYSLLNADPIRDVIDNSDLSLQELSRRTGISCYGLSQIKGDKTQHVAIKTAFKLAEQLGTINDDGGATIGPYKLQKIDPHAFGAFMRSCREICLLSQEEFIDYFGLPRIFVANAERNKIDLIKYDQLEEIASTFNCVASDILGYDPEDEITLTKKAVQKFMQKRLISREEIARFIARSGISNNVLWYITNGSHRPFKKQIRKICRYFSCNAFEIASHDPSFDRHKQRCSGFQKLSQLHFAVIAP